MARFIVVPKSSAGRRETHYEVIDTDPKSIRSASRCRIGNYDEYQMAAGLAETLNGAAAVFDAEVSKLRNEESF